MQRVCLVGILTWITFPKAIVVQDAIVKSKARVQSRLTCCSNSMVLMACLQGRIIMGNPTATDIMKPTRIISVTRLEGKFISTFPSMVSVKLT